MMNKIYYNLMKVYITDSAKLIEERITKNDLVIVDEQAHNASIAKFQQQAPLLDSQSSA